MLSVLHHYDVRLCRESVDGGESEKAVQRGRMVTIAPAHRETRVQESGETSEEATR